MVVVAVETISCVASSSALRDFAIVIIEKREREISGGEERETHPSYC